MGTEVNLMRDYPSSSARLLSRPKVTEYDRTVSRRFGKEYFDGKRRFGYGGYYYHPKFWEKTVVNFKSHYNLQENARILDVGCAKGFMLKDFKRLLPDSEVFGLDISEYAISNADPEVRDNLILGNAVELPFEDKSFDLVVSINTIHNLERNDCSKALSEIQRVSKLNSFVMVDGWKTQTERQNLESWVVSARTIMSAEQWILLFHESKFDGDYYFWNVQA